jgi:malto-oligosyltrehalose trehalohydrolase
MPFGCEVEDDGHCCFQLWAPAVEAVQLELHAQGHEYRLPMEPAPDGWYRHRSALARPGDLYRYRLPDGLCVPDPASRYQPEDVHGFSQVVDPRAFAWQDLAWRGRPWHESVIYELHVGSFSPSGDFAGVASKLDALRALGVTAIELMPIADFPGRWNWGYDGALWFAPDSRYGTPEDLKQLIGAAHARELMVFLDVVYNHFGPEGNYLHCYAPGFFDPSRHTPWGAAIGFDQAGNRPVREFIIANALYWLVEYGFDGLRLDAVYRILDNSQPDILDELATRVRQSLGCERQVHLILEHDDNEARRYRRDSAGKPLFFTAQWNDDAHHALHAALTGESEGVYQDYAADPFNQLGQALAQGFCYQGEASAFRGGRRRGTPSGHLPPATFVNFLQNHDQIGNRAHGERLEHLIAPAAFEAALAVILLAPAIPLLFMGQEFAASTPFLFFCDLEPDLLIQVKEGRRREFAGQAAFSDPARLHAIPAPSDPQSFAASCLDWNEDARAPGRERLALHQKLLRLRARHITPLLPRLQHGGHWHRYGTSGLAWQWATAAGETLHLQANLGSAPIAPESAGPATAVPSPSARCEQKAAKVTRIFEHPAAADTLWPAHWVRCWREAPLS